MGIVTGTLSADGSSNVAKLVSGKGTIAAAGDFGGGTLTLNISYDSGVTFVPALADVVNAENAALTDDGAFMYEVVGGEGCQVKLVLSGSTAPDIDYWIATE